jgi:hypothetical protein
MNVDFAHLFALGGVARWACILQIPALCSAPCTQAKNLLQTLHS